MWHAWSHLLLGLLVAGLALTWLRRAARFHRRPLRLALCFPLAAVFLGAALIAAAGFYLVACTFRLAPEPITRDLFPGAAYERRVIADPGADPAVVHVVRIDLAAPGLSFHVTPPDAPDTPEPVRLRTTSAYLAEHDLDLALNANFFAGDGSIAERLWDVRPRTGTPVRVLGVAASDGVRYGSGAWMNATLYLGPGARASFTEPDAGITHAVAGIRFLVRDGLAVQAIENDTPDPRTAAGLDAAGRTLTFVLADGRQPGYSAGLTRVRLAALLAELGAHTAIELDGGGSSTLVVADPIGSPRLLNCPIHTRWPGRERPVANHLGLRLRP